MIKERRENNAGLARKLNVWEKYQVKTNMLWRSVHVATVDGASWSSLKKCFHKSWTNTWWNENWHYIAYNRHLMSLYFLRQPDSLFHSALVYPSRSIYRGYYNFVQRKRIYSRATQKKKERKKERKSVQRVYMQIRSCKKKFIQLYCCILIRQVYTSIM